MPEIDAVTMATPPGGVAQSMLFSLPADWPRGRYALVARDQRRGRLQRTPSTRTTFPTPTQPPSTWDSWAMRLRLPLSRPAVARVQRAVRARSGERRALRGERARGPLVVGRVDEDYGALEAMAGVTNDPAGAPGERRRPAAALRAGRASRRAGATLSDRPEAPARPPPTEPEPEPEAETPDGGKPAGIDGSADAGTSQRTRAQPSRNRWTSDQGDARAPADDRTTRAAASSSTSPTASARAVGSDPRAAARPPPGRVARARVDHDRLLGRRVGRAAAWLRSARQHRADRRRATLHPRRPAGEDRDQDAGRARSR